MEENTEESADKITYHEKRSMAAKFAKEKLLLEACNACKLHAKGECRKITEYGYSLGGDSPSRECFYEYLSMLPEKTQDEYYHKAMASDKRSAEPCCDHCRYRMPYGGDDIPGSHLLWGWDGECEHPDAHRETSSHYFTSPKWCPFRKKENRRIEDWISQDDVEIEPVEDKFGK